MSLPLLDDIETSTKRPKKRQVTIKIAEVNGGFLVEVPVHVGLFTHTEKFVATTLQDLNTILTKITQRVFGG
jgi:hypothetical protein